MPEMPSNDAPYRLISGVEFGEGVVVYSFTNLYGCRIGAGTRIGPLVEIQAGAVVGARCKLQSHAFVCDGVEIGDGVFVGHGVMSGNDKRPRAITEAGGLAGPDDWELVAGVFVADAAAGLREADVRVIPSGVAIPPEVREPVEPPHVLFVGRLSEEKGILDLLEATEGWRA
jgi:carbonic anhydrase/acetyltransferase-like protein (isoleucine patch superfamily)